LIFHFSTLAKKRVLSTAQTAFAEQRPTHQDQDLVVLSKRGKEAREKAGVAL
jgi:hypothetical protein